MGWGDEIIATAQARALHVQDPRKVALRGKDGKARWHPVWDHNPRLAHPAEVERGMAVQWLENRSGNRPYINYEKTTRERYAWNDWRCEPGEIYLTDAEKALARHCAGAIVIEPNLKHGATINKDWGFARWQALVGKLKGQYELVQLGAPGVTELKGVRRIVTYSPREASGYLAGARAAVLPEGGMHHAAAALGIPAVVIFGGYIGPKTTGYAMHRNIFTARYACGIRAACGHCGEAMAAIQPGRVAGELAALLEPQNVVQQEASA